MQMNILANSDSLLPLNDSIEDCPKDGGEEFFTEMHWVRMTSL